MIDQFSCLVIALLITGVVFDPRCRETAFAFADAFFTFVRDLAETIRARFR